MRPESDDPLQSYSVPQTAKLLGKGQSSVKTLIHNGELFAFISNEDASPERIRYRIPAFAIRNFMEKRAVAAAPSTRRRNPKVVSSRRYF
ncbi:MAG: helix-turn-helix domain-containing protein [Planctomycetaceae bacterium]|nr:helix-turn-helix domain-containing protein [Planctomycetaceae bacterium]